VSVDENRRHYERRSVGARYARKSELQTAEAAILRRYEPEISGGRILDLGVGGGRTTPFLLELSSSYVGVDYSLEMIERCRGRFPAVEFQPVDARDLSAFTDSTFDFVLFSNNGIDAVGHDDRLNILGEVHRTLKDGGLFVFSSHNRNSAIATAWDLQHFDVNPLRDPVRFGKKALSYPLGIINYFRRARRNRVEDEYCIEVDAGNLYSLVHYRITARAQKRQLERVGFCEVETVGMDGRSLSPDECQSIDEPWIHYVCRRSSVAVEPSVPNRETEISRPEPNPRTRSRR
jgi:SAM-dependent methyltransferase